MALKVESFAQSRGWGTNEVDMGWGDLGEDFAPLTLHTSDGDAVVSRGSFDVQDVPPTPSTPAPEPAKSFNVEVPADLLVGHDSKGNEIVKASASGSGGAKGFWDKLADVAVKYSGGKTDTKLAVQSVKSKSWLSDSTAGIPNQFLAAAGAAVVGVLVIRKMRGK